MSSSPLVFEKVFYVTTSALHLNRAHPFIKRNWFWVFQFLIILTLSVATFVVTVNSLLFYDIPAGRFADASKNGTMSIVALTITIKYVFLLYIQNYLSLLIDTINKDYEQSKDYVDEERDIILKYCHKGARVSTYWFVSTTMTSILFPLKAFILMGLYYWEGDFKFVHMFDMRYPTSIEIIKETAAMFVVLFLLCLMFDVYAATMYVGFDPLVPIFLTHICGQLDILSRRMMEIFLSNKSSNPKEINEKLKQINIKLQDLYNMIENIIAKFTFLYEFTMKTTTILLPLSMFQITEDLQRKKLNLEFIAFLFAAVLHFYMPCYYSDLLMEQSANLRKSIYSCGWEMQSDSRARKTVLLMLTRTTAPLALTTVFYPICLDTFAEMVRQSYAIFSIMNVALT